MTKHIIRASTLMIIAALVLTGCGQGMQASNSASDVAGAGGAGGGTQQADQAWAKADMTGAIAGSTYNQMQVISLDKTNMQLVIMIPTPLPIGLPVGTQIAIPQLPGATIGMETSGSGVTGLALRIPLSYVMHGATFLPPGTLPNGDPLTSVGIPDGELPQLGISLNQTGNIKASIYLGTTVVGLFLSTPVSIPFAMRFPIRMADQSTIGYFSTVPAKGQYPGGFFLSVQIPDNIAAIIDNVL